MCLAARNSNDFIVLFDLENPLDLCRGLFCSIYQLHNLLSNAEFDSCFPQFFYRVNNGKDFDSSQFNSAFGTNIGFGIKSTIFILSFAVVALHLCSPKVLKGESQSLDQDSLFGSVQMSFSLLRSLKASSPEISLDLNILWISTSRVSLRFFSARFAALCSGVSFEDKP